MLAWTAPRRDKEAPHENPPTRCFGAGRRDGADRLRPRRRPRTRPKRTNRRDRPDLPEPPRLPGPPRRKKTAALPAVAGELYRVEQDGQPLFNAGDRCYELLPRNGYMLVSYVDYATAEQRVLCSVPGCAHASEDCPALPRRNGATAIPFLPRGRVYTYTTRLLRIPIPGSWEEYYDEYVRPGLADPALREGMTEQEFAAFHRGWYGERSLPAGCLCWTARARPAGGSRFPAAIWIISSRCHLVRWRGAVRLCYDALPTGNSAGYRIALADGGVTTFRLRRYERIVDAQGDRLLTTPPRGRRAVARPQPIPGSLRRRLAKRCGGIRLAGPGHRRAQQILGNALSAAGRQCVSVPRFAGGKLYFHKRNIPRRARGCAAFGLTTRRPGPGRRSSTRWRMIRCSCAGPGRRRCPVRQNRRGVTSGWKAPAVPCWILAGSGTPHKTN